MAAEAGAEVLTRGTPGRLRGRPDSGEKSRSSCARCRNGVLHPTV